MAIEYMRFESIGSRSARLADYIQRQGEYERKKGDFICGGNAGLPSWAENPHDFFLEAEKQEKGEIGKHVIIALPKELNLEENRKLAEETISELFPSHTYVWGIHQNTGVLSGENNPHLHILVCDRKIEKERAEPPREIYFKKSRTLKTGEISGGYRKDPLLSGHERQKGLILKKMKLQEIMNKHIREHNEKTGEKVRKIDFAERHGKGMPHMGKKAVSMGIKSGGKVVGKEINRRLRPLAEKQAKRVKEAERQMIDKSVKIGVLSHVKNLAESFIENPLNPSKIAENFKNREIAEKTEKMSDKIRKKIAENNEKNAEIAEKIVQKEAEKYTENIKKAAAERGEKQENSYVANSALSEIRNIEFLTKRVKEKSENIIKNQRKSEENQIYKLDSETDEIIRDFEKKSRESLKNIRNPQKIAKNEIKEISQKPMPEPSKEQEKTRETPPKITVKAKKQERNKGFSR